MIGKRALRVRAFAKINLLLRVMGTRTDGYHELRTIFQSLALHDVLTVVPKRGSLTLVCDVEGCPTDETNLVWRAAERVWRAAGRSGEPHGVRVQLQKNIPLQAGLGGGSSDAAAALRAFGAIWRVKVEALREIAGELGADVPYFFEGGTALGLDRGDQLFPMIDAPRAAVVLALPEFGVSTRDAFGWFDRTPTPGTAERTHANDLEPVVAAQHPEIASLVELFSTAGARQAAMTGSGSAVFGLFDSPQAAQRAAGRLVQTRTRGLLTRTVSRAEYQRRSRPELS